MLSVDHGEGKEKQPIWNASLIQPVIVYECLTSFTHLLLTTFDTAKVESHRSTGHHCPYSD